MLTKSQPSSDNSVTFSLAELAKLEEERVRQEDAERARVREAEAKSRREAEARRRAAEVEHVALEAKRRAELAREAAAEQARLEARERAAIQVAQIEAAAKVRLDADNAARAHELAMLRARGERGGRRLQHVLGAALGLVLCAGAAGAYAGSRHLEGLEQETTRLREAQVAQAREREQARSTELAALDRRHAALLARAPAGGAEEARTAAASAREAIDPRSPDRDRMRAFGDALEALETRLASLQKIAELDRRHADLGVWAAERRKSDAAAAARSAALRARTLGDDSAIRAYEGALDQLRDTLASSAPGGGRRVVPPVTGTGECQGPGDPFCGLNGRPL